MPPQKPIQWVDIQSPPINWVDVEARPAPEKKGFWQGLIDVPSELLHGVDEGSKESMKHLEAGNYPAAAMSIFKPIADPFTELMGMAGKKIEGKPVIELPSDPGERRLSAASQALGGVGFPTAGFQEAWRAEDYPRIAGQAAGAALTMYGGHRLANRGRTSTGPGGGGEPRQLDLDFGPPPPKQLNLPFPEPVRPEPVQQGLPFNDPLQLDLGLSGKYTPAPRVTEGGQGMLFDTTPTPVPERVIPPKPPVNVESEALPRVVTLDNPDPTMVELLRNQGYVSVPGMRSPEGKVQMVRGDVAPLYTNAETRPAQAAPIKPVEPVRSDVPGPLREGEVPAGDTVSLPTSSVNETVISNLKEGGYKLVSTDGVMSIFKKLLKGESGEFTPAEMREELRRRFGREPSVGEIVNAIQEQYDLSGFRTRPANTINTHDELTQAFRQANNEYSEMVQRHGFGDETTRVAGRLTELLTRRQRLNENEVTPRYHDLDLNAPEPYPSPTEGQRPTRASQGMSRDEQAIIRRDDIREIGASTTREAITDIQHFWRQKIDEAGQSGDDVLRKHAEEMYELAQVRLADIMNEGTNRPVRAEDYPGQNAHRAELLGDDHTTDGINSAETISHLVEKRRYWQEQVDRETTAGLDPWYAQGIIDLINTRLSRIAGGEDTTMGMPPIPDPVRQARPVRGRVVRDEPDWKVPYQYYDDVHLTEEGPLPREPLLPFAEELNPRAIMEDAEGIIEEGGRTRQKKLPFKLEIPKSKYDRLLASVDRYDLEQPHQSERALADWESTAESALKYAKKEGPPGLRVEKGAYGPGNIVFRNKKGEPIAVAHLVMGGDGKPAVSMLGKKLERRMVKGQWKVTSTPEADMAAVYVFEKIVDMDATAASGTISSNTANVIKQAQRFVYDDSGFVDVGEIMKLFSRLKQKLTSRLMERGETVEGKNSLVMLTKRFLGEEEGTFKPGEMWQNVKEKTGWGQGDKAAGKKNPDEFNFVKEALAIPSAATTTGDFSAPGRQGLSMIATPQFWKAAGAMFKGLSPESFKRIDAELNAKPIFQKKIDLKTGKVGKSFAEEIGMKLFRPASEAGPRAEATASRWMETGGNIPYASAAYRKTVGVPVRASNRAFITFLNHLNANRTEFLLNKARDMSVEAITTGKARQGTLPWKQRFTPEQAAELNPYKNTVLAKEIADFVNTATGHGPLKTHILPFKQAEVSLESAASKLNYIFFSPRLLASRMRMMNPNTYIMASPFVRKQYLKAALSTAAAWFAYTELAKLAGGDDVEVSNEITSADFGKIRIGDARLDPAGGFLQFLVAYGRLYHGGSTSSASGEFKRFGSGYQANTQEDMMERFFVNKLNPVTKFAYDLGNASEYNPFHVGDRTMQMFVPLIAQDINELAKENPDLIPFFGPAALFGGGTQIYGKGESVSKFIEPENDWLVTGGGFRDLMPWNWGEGGR